MLLSARFRFDADLAKPLLAALPLLMLTQGISEGPPEWLRIGLSFWPMKAGVAPVGILFIEFVRGYPEVLPVGAST